MYVYIQSEFSGRDGATNGLWTVGFYQPDGTWQAESDWISAADAAKRVAYLNGGAVLAR